MPAKKPERTPLEQAENEAFARKLTGFMAQKGFSQSDLARAVWGTVTDTRGRDVARNRDRISHYVRGSQMPESRTLKALAEALGVEVTDLSPKIGTAGGAQKPPPYSFTVVGGRSDVAMLTVHHLVPTRLAAEIVMMLSKAEPVAPNGLPT